MPDTRTVKKIYHAKLNGIWRHGKPKKRWKEVVLDNIKRLSVKNYKSVVQDRNRWKNIVKETLPHKGKKEEE